MFKRIASVVLVAAIPLSAMACGGSVTSEPAATAQAAATKAPVAQGAHGQLKIIGAALGEVPLRPTQRADIEKLVAESEARHQPVAAARKDLALAIAAQVEAGAIDRAALQPKIDAVATTMDAARTADRAAFETLHGILDADQRAAFVDAMKAKAKDFHEEHGKKGEHHAHGGGPMKAWAADLKLTDEQKSQLHDAMKARFQAMRDQHKGERHDEHGMREQGLKVLEAFKSDHFVMDEIAPKQDVKAHATKFADGMLGFVETALPILTPEQRTLAAQKIRDHAAHEEAK